MIELMVMMIICQYNKKIVMLRNVIHAQSGVDLRGAGMDSEGLIGSIVSPL